MTSVCYFWKSDCVFSNWYMDAPFELDEHKFTCVEQYMMWRKACLFGDQASAAKLLVLSHPADCRELGRRVQGFKQDVWDQEKVAIVEAGVRAKFAQNEQAKQQLLSTKGQLLAEAAPWDAIWGIGISEREARRVGVKGWPGKNLLGQILMRVRDEFLSNSALRNPE